MRKKTVEEKRVIAISQVQAYVKRVGKTPTARAFNEDQQTVCATTVQKLFGSWNNFLEAAGLRIATKRYSNYSDDLLIEQVKALAKKLGKTPTAREWQDSTTTACYATVAHRFGSWNKFLLAASLKPNMVRLQK